MISQNNLYDQILPTPNILINHFRNYKNISLSNQTLKVLYMNAQSLKNKIEQLNYILNRLSKTIDIIAVTEIWVNDDQLSCLNVNNYNVVSVGRKSREGVCIFVHDCIQHYDIVEKYDDNVYGYTTIHIKTNTYDLYIHVFYNPHTNSIQQYNSFTDIFEPLIEKYGGKKNIIFGDFNINTKDKTNNWVKLYRSMLNRNSFFLYNDTSTTRPATNTAIDHVIGNVPSLHANLNYLDVDFSDHKLILCEFYTIPQKHAGIKNKTYESTDFNSLHTDINEHTFLLPTNANCNVMFDMLLEQLQLRKKRYTTTKHMQKKKSNKYLKPWVDDELFNIARNKHYWFKKLKNAHRKNFAPYDITKIRTELKYWENKYTHLRRAKKANHMNGKLENARNPKEIWKSIRYVIADGVVKPVPDVCVKKSSQIITDPKLVAETINDYFVEVGITLSQQFAAPNHFTAKLAPAAYKQ